MAGGEAFPVQQSFAPSITAGGGVPVYSTATTIQSGEWMSAVAAMARDTVELFAVGLGPTNPAVPAGQAFSGASPTTTSVNVLINNVDVMPTFAGSSSAGPYQINLTVPPGLGAGDVSLQVNVGGSKTPSGVVVSLQ
jgi:uncharacterized protein (TIGR03437 family)